MKAWLKKHYLKILIPLLIVGALIGLIAFPLNATKNWHSPLMYCIWEIQSHENYDCDYFTYYYEELEPKAEIQKEADKFCDIYVYYITCFTDERKGEWYCGIECESSVFPRALGKQWGYDPWQVRLIDCDLVLETIIM